jgi:mediator of RNA polymerase II transcription subunit 12
MKKQLADIALPSAPRPGLNIKQTFKGVLADAEGREKWISRFSYWYVLQRLPRNFQNDSVVLA